MAFTIEYSSQQPVTDFSLPFSTYKYAAALAASTDTPLTIPGAAKRWIAVIKSSDPGGHVWVSLNTVFVAPGASFAQTDAELLDVIAIAREVQAGDVLHFFTTSTGVDISVVLYAFHVTN